MSTNRGFMVCINIAKICKRKIRISTKLRNPTFQNEFFFDVVKVMTTFEKILKDGYTYIRLYKNFIILRNLLKINLKNKKNDTKLA